MPIKKEDIPRLLDNEENRIRRIADFLRTNADKAYRLKDIQEETKIECVRDLLENTPRYFKLVRKLHIKSVEVIRKEEGDGYCGSAQYYYYDTPKGRWSKWFG